MAQKKPTESALKNVLETAVELLQDADDTGDGTVVLEQPCRHATANGGQRSHRRRSRHRREQ